MKEKYFKPVMRKKGGRKDSTYTLSRTMANFATEVCLSFCGQGLAWCYCFHQLIGRRFSEEHLGSVLAGTEDWTVKMEYS